MSFLACQMLSEVLSVQFVMSGWPCQLNLKRERGSIRGNYAITNVIVIDNNCNIIKGNYNYIIMFDEFQGGAFDFS